MEPDAKKQARDAIYDAIDSLVGALRYIDGDDFESAYECLLDEAPGFLENAHRALSADTEAAEGAEQPPVDAGSNEAALESQFKAQDSVMLLRASEENGLRAGILGRVLRVLEDEDPARLGRDPLRAYEVQFIGARGTVTMEVNEDLLAPAPESQRVPSGAVDGGNAVSMLMEHITKRRLTEPHFAYAKSGPDHAPTFTCTCRVGSTSKIAHGNSKNDAKRAAAAAMLEALR
jgi:hypothetical protein